MKNKFIILFHPKSSEEDIGSLPLSSLAIAGPLLKKKYKVKIVNASVELDYDKKILNLIDDAICIGISSMTGYQIKDGLMIAKKIKEKNKNIPIIWGGWHPSLLPEQTIMNPYVDIIVKGQGYITFCELVETLIKKESLKNIFGIVYEKNGKIIKNPERQLINLNKIPEFPYEMINVEEVLSSQINTRTISYITSQGCPYRCKFCADSKLYKRKWNSFSADRVLRDLQTLIERYNVNGIRFEDTNFFVDEKRVKEICKGIIKNKWNLKWMASARTEQLLRFDKETLKLIKESGCKHMGVGAESGSQRILDMISKDTTVKDTTDFASLIKDYEIKGTFCFMVGFPGEPWEDLKQTIQLIKKIKKINQNNEIRVFFYTPYPGTPLYDISLKHGMKEPKSFSEWANFTYDNINTPWINKKYKRVLNNLLFYIQTAYPNEELKKKMENSKIKLIYKIIHWDSLFRIKANFLNLQFEANLFHIFKRFNKE